MLHLSSGVHLVKGAQRAALYDDRAKVVFGLTAVEESVVGGILARGKVAWSSARPLRDEQIKALRWLQANDYISTKQRIDTPPSRPDSSSFEHIWLELSNVCNLSCQHCYANSGPRADTSGNLTNDQWRHLIDKCMDVGVNILTFIGGEPFSRADALEALIPYIRSKSESVSIRIFSNLTQSSRIDRLIPLMKKCNVSVGTSIYGYEPDRHDLFTLSPGSWAKTVKSIELLRAQDIPVFVGVYVTGDANDETLYFQRFLASLGITDFRVLNPSHVGRGRALTLSNDLRPNRRHRTMDYSFGDFSWNRGGHNCFRNHLAIKPNGDVLPCIMMRENKYGNLLLDSFSDVRATTAFKELSMLSKDQVDGCKDCEFRYGCFDCRPDAIGNTGNLSAKPDCGYDPYAGSYEWV